MTRTNVAADSETRGSRRLGPSIKTRFYLVIAAVLVVVVGMFAIGKTGLDALSAVRAYVGGEGLWSKGQGEAAFHLQRYIATGDETDHAEYLRSLAVPLSLRQARLELESPDPDPEEIRRGFIEAGVSRADVDGMIWLFRWFGWLEPIQEAADTWARGDARVAELQALGRRTHDRIRAGDASPDELRSLSIELSAVHHELIDVATEFSDTLGNAARWARSLLIRVLVGFTLIGTAVCLIGLILVTRIGADLERSNRVLTERNRQRSGQNALHEHLQGQQSLETMLGNVMGFLAEFVDAQIGAIYVAQDGDVLRLAGSHGIGARDGLPGELALGQGIVGQAARDGKSQLLTDVPDEYLKISTAFSEGRPGHLFVLPLMYAGETKAVVELGAVHPFDRTNLDFLQSVATNIALSVQTVQAKDQVDALLEESQQQAEELEAQQEELRQTNEELEAQAAALEESQTELEETNSALEEKTEAVAMHRAEVEKKNADLEVAQKQLAEKARKLATTSQYKSEFLANMSHELRTPLNSIILLSDLLSQNKESNLTEKQVEFARTIMSSGSDLLDLINEVLDLTKVEAGRMELNIETIELADFLSVLERGFQQTAKEKDLSFTVQIAEDVPSHIGTDERRLGQILKNLLSNAIKFTDEGGVELMVERADPADATYRGQSLPADPAIAFSVVDTGIGIPENEMGLVFEAFKQVEGSTSRKYGGTGLGLSISRELTELLGGEVFIESTVGEGSRFTIVVPATLAPRAVAGIAVVPDDEPAPTGSGEVPATPRDAASDTPADATVETAAALPMPYVQDDRKDIGPDDRCLLIVEDDRGFARVLLDLAREHGFMGLVAEDGRTALQLAEYYEPSGVLLDIGLPDIDGMSIMERLKENLATRHIPVHVISAGQRKFEALKKGAVGFLRKPTNVAQLHEAFDRIERLLSRPVRQLLVVVGDDEFRDEIVRLIGAEDVEITSAASGEDALARLLTATFDCVLLVADLPDMGGAELLMRIRSSTTPSDLPVVAIVDEEPSGEERMTLDRYADSIVVRDGRYSERLLDETALFLHRVEKDLPEDKRRILRLLHDNEAILNDKTVLIVDDDMRNIFALSSILEERNMQTVAAKTGSEALDRLEQHAEIDVVLMDIMMPEMDGYEAMRRIRANPAFKKLPIIALTAKAMRGDRAKCIEAGASDYLAKPVDADRLFSMLRVWLYG